MSPHALILLALFLVMVLALGYPLAIYMTDALEGRSVGAAGLARRILGPVESRIFRLCGIRADAQMRWLEYTLSILLFSTLGALAVYALQRLQGLLPLNPQGLGAVSPDSSLNTAVAFVTNTDWQGYAGESTMSYLTQMLGLACRTSCPPPPASWSSWP